MLKGIEFLLKKSRAFKNSPRSLSSLLRCAHNDDRQDEIGRSMIEMLGVLAIIGVLSVGGISGYSKAMEKFKLNKTVSEYSYFIFNMFEHGDEFKKLPEGTGLAKLAEQLDLLPASWKYIASNNGERWVRDGLQNKIQMWQTGGHLVFEIYLPIDENAKKLDLCRSLLKDFIHPLHDFARNAYVWRERPEKKDEAWWGTNYCGGERKCLKDVTVTAMDAACRSCVDSQGSCSIVLTY